MNFQEFINKSTFVDSKFAKRFLQHDKGRLYRTIQ